MNNPDRIASLNAALEGRYRIERELGEGGMATVYLADDLKHERRVALKVLKPELAAVVGAERFLTEIKTTANLQHPHILPLFDSGEADGFLFYVMPFIEGETLRDRLDRERQLPVDEALGIATAVANALQTAHDQGVVHRDIKPGNILLSRGEPLVADFGIALAVSAGGGGRLTETGLSLGTPYYMSPEQATGDQAVGPASDTFALACVLYEMLVGEPPYPGTTAQAVLGKIIQGVPVSATSVRKSIPANVDAAIRKALEKLPADRFTGPQHFARALADQGFRHGEPAGVSSATGAGWWKPIGIASASIAVVASTVAGWALWGPEQPQPVERFAVELGLGAVPVVLPDGSGAVFVTPNEAGQQQLFLRRWENLEPQPIPGTEGSAIFDPAIAPSGVEVAVVVNGQLKVAPLGGGIVRTLIDAADCCVTWGPDGFVYYTDENGATKRVPASGGTAEVVLEPETDGEFHGHFRVLSGREVAVLGVWGQQGEDDRIEAVRMATGERAALTPGLKPIVTPAGQLIFASGNGQILGAPFDPDRMELTGPVVPLVEGLFVSPNREAAYNLSESGDLLYLAGTAGSLGQMEFVWVTRSGSAEPIDPGYMVSLPTNSGWRLSPDETRVVFNSMVEGVNDVRIKHLPDGPEERITFGDDDEYRPVWHPDGRSVTYFAGPAFTDVNVWSRRADGTGEAVLVLDDERSLAQGTWSPDGEWLVFRAGATAAMGLGMRDILAFRPGVDSAAVPLVANPEFFEGAPEISPNGRWLAYISNEAGQQEVFVRPFPNVDSTRVRVSANGGSGPVWAKTGRELFFVDGGRNLISAPFDPASGLLLGQETLFTLPAGYVMDAGNNFYDVTSDGQRFLMARAFTDDDEGDDAGPGLILVQNFSEDIKRLVPN